MHDSEEVYAIYKKKKIESYNIKNGHLKKIHYRKK